MNKKICSLKNILGVVGKMKGQLTELAAGESFYRDELI